MKIVYHCNCHSTNFVRTKRLKLAKDKRKLRTFWGWEVETQKITLTVIYIPFEILLRKRWPGKSILLQFSWGHNQTPKVASNIRELENCAGFTACTSNRENYQVHELFPWLTDKNVSWKIRHSKNILRLKIF